MAVSFQPEAVLRMTYFLWGTIILFIATAIFYIGFFSLVYYWHEKKITLVVMPLLFTFEFFLIGFLVVAIASLVLQSIPQIFILFA